MKKLILLATILLVSPLWGDGRAAAQTINAPGSGNALDFDGVSNHVDVVHSAFWDFGADDFSISLWVKFNDTIKNTQGLVLHAINGTSAINGWALVWNSVDGLNFYTGMSGGPNGIFGSGSFTPLNKWIHICLVRNGTTWKLYQNGIAIKTSSNSVTIGPVNTPLRFAQGITYTSGNVWTGEAAFFANIEMDEVQIWNRALTQTEIQQNMCSKLPDCADPSLVGYWRFDEGTDNTCSGGQDVCDASCNGNHGIKF